MKYNVGDKVKIREDLKDNEIYGNGCWDATSDMVSRGGMIATITKCEEDSYRIDVDNGFYSWVDEIFEEVEVKEVDDNKQVRTVDMLKTCINNNTVMTVEDLLNKTDVEKGGLIITVYYSNAYFETTIGHNKINRNSELYKRFIKAYGDMIVDEVSFDIRNENMVVMLIKVDYADNN